MKTLEYVVLALFLSALVYLGATQLGNALSASFNASAARIESAGR